MKGIHALPLRQSIPLRARRRARSPEPIRHQRLRRFAGRGPKFLRTRRIPRTRHGAN